jgi:AcrR family transcriptional regulator
MEAKTVDRRVQRTKNLLHNALISLILEKGYDAITVQDIIDRANVGRSTFYAHFWDKDQLLLSGLEIFREMFENQHKALPPDQSDKEEAGLGISLVLFQHTGENHRLYKAFIGKGGGELVMQQVRKYLTEQLAEHLKVILPDEKASGMPREVVVVFLSNSLLGMLTWWLDNDMPYPAEQINKMFYQLAVRPLINANKTPN